METTFLILFLIFLEGVLSFDNALALAALVKHLPQTQQRKALTYGICGAYAFRIISLFLIIHILENPWVRIIGGLYLCWVAFAGLFPKDKDDGPSSSVPQSLWRTIALVEFTDIFFSFDSILASAAVSQIFWVVLTGGLIGIVMMRFVSGIFIKMMNVFPRLEKSAFLLVAVVGMKLLIQALWPSMEVEHLSWLLVAGSLLFGFSIRSYAFL